MRHLQIGPIFGFISIEEWKDFKYLGSPFALKHSPLEIGTLFYQNQGQDGSLGSKMARIS